MNRTPGGSFFLFWGPYFIFYILFYLPFSKLIENSYKKPYFTKNKQKINIKFIKMEFLLQCFKANTKEKICRWVKWSYFMPTSFSRSLKMRKWSYLFHSTMWVNYLSKRYNSIFWKRSSKMKWGFSGIIYWNIKYKEENCFSKQETIYDSVNCGDD